MPAITTRNELGGDRHAFDQKISGPGALYVIVYVGSVSCYGAERKCQHGSLSAAIRGIPETNARFEAYLF